MKASGILMYPLALLAGCALALWMALDREARIEAAMEMGGEDAVSDADSRWMERRNARRRRGRAG